MVDAFADAVDPRWINVDSFIESFATVGSYDIDEIFVRTATDRQARVLAVSRKMQVRRLNFAFIVGVHAVGFFQLFRILIAPMSDVAQL